MQTVSRSTDYRLIDSAVRTEFLRFTEHNRITRGLIDWLGFRQEYVEFDSPPRLAGDATYAISLVAGVVTGIEQFLLGDPLGLKLTGSALFSVFVAFLIGLVLTAQGIMALYLSHVHTQAQNRPLFVIDYAHSTNLSAADVNQ